MWKIPGEYIFFRTKNPCTITRELNMELWFLQLRKKHFSWLNHSKREGQGRPYFGKAVHYDICNE